MRYFLLSILEKIPVPLSLGLCLPQPCSIKDVEDFKPKLVEIISSSLPYLFEEVRGFEDKNSLDPDDFKIFEPIVENKQATHFGKGSCLTVVLSAWIVMLSIVSTAIAWR